MANDDVVGAIAETIAAASAQTGAGFLLARLAADQILDGTLALNTPDLEQLLHGLAVELLLDRGAGAGDLALLQALALAAEPGLPGGEVWQVAASALNPRVETGLDAQLDFLNRMGRFVVEVGDQGEAAYRLFHPALREQLLFQLGGPSGPGVAAAAAALLDLRRRRYDAQQAPGTFLALRLPLIVARLNDPDMALAAVKGGPETLVDAQVDALIAVASERRAVGNLSSAQQLAQIALRASDTAGSLTRARALIAQSEAVLDDDMWREARDMSTSALELLDELLELEPDRPDLLAAAAQGARMLALALGQGGFDARAGAVQVSRMVVRVSGAPPGPLLSLAPSIADMLQSYGESLWRTVRSEVVAEATTIAGNIREWLVKTGREDLRVALAISRTYTALARRDQEEAGWLDELSNAAELALGSGPLQADRILPLAQVVGELAQALGLAGRHEQALVTLDDFIAASGPALEGAGPAEGFAAGVIGALELRSTVHAVLGSLEPALADAERAVDLALRLHESGEIRLPGVRVTLAQRWLDLGRPEKAVELLEPGHALQLSHINQVEAALHTVATAMLANEPGHSVEALASALDQIDPGKLQLPENHASHFNAFGLELRVGAALVDGLTALERYDDADRAKARAARAFVAMEGLGSPLRLLHLQPWLLEVFEKQLALAAAQAGAHDWEEAFILLEHRGRTAVLEAFSESGPHKGPRFSTDHALELAIEGDVDGAISVANARDAFRWPANAALVIELKILSALQPPLATSLLAVADALDMV